jgi:hypothetical protein
VASIVQVTDKFISNCHVFVSIFATFNQGILSPHDITIESIASLFVKKFNGNDSEVIILGVGNI